MLQPRYLFTQDFSVFRTALLSLPHRVRRFERGESLWAAGTPFEKIFFFDAGLARTSIISVSGSNRVIAWQGPGTMFPVIHRNRFEIETRHLTEAVTQLLRLNSLRSILKRICAVLLTLHWQPSIGMPNSSICCSTLRPTFQLRQTR